MEGARPEEAGQDVGQGALCERQEVAMNKSIKARSKVLITLKTLIRREGVLGRPCAVRVCALIIWPQVRPGLCIARAGADTGVPKKGCLTVSARARRARNF